MYKMSKKSLIGRIALLPVFLPVIALELLLNKADDWSFSIRRLRRRMEQFADDKFPLANDKKTNI